MKFVICFNDQHDDYHGVQVPSYDSIAEAGQEIYAISVEEAVEVFIENEHDGNMDEITYVDGDSPYVMKLIVSERSEREFYRKLDVKVEQIWKYHIKDSDIEW